MRRVVCIALCAGSLATLSAMKANAESLDEAWALALQNDHALAAVRLETQAATLDAAAARAQRYPSLTASGSFVQFQDAPAFDFSAAGIAVQMPEVVDNDNTLMGSVMLSVPLYTGGRIRSAVRAAAQGQRARESGEAQAVQNTRLAVAEAYVQVLRAQRALSVAQSNETSLDAYAAEVKSMFDREMVARNDLLAADVALADARQNRSRARNAVSLARAAYNRRLGQPLTREVDLDESLPAPATPLDREPIERLTERALANRGELKALEAQALAVGYQADAERARVRPQLVLSGGYSYLGNDVLDRQDFVTASLGFSWPVFDGGVARNRSAALRRQQNAVQERRADTEAMIALEVQQAVLDSQETQARVAVTADAVTQSEENLRITRQQYQAGLVISTRVLEAESLRVISRTNHDNAVLDAALAQYRLARAVGEL